MRSLHFTSNRAVRVIALKNKNRGPAVERRKMTLDEAEGKDVEWLKSLESGRGGALYFDLSSIGNVICLDVHIKHTTIDKNSAYMGGNAYRQLTRFLR